MKTLLDTRAVAPGDRLEYWSAGIAEHFFPITFSDAPEGFRARLSGGQVGPVAIRSLRAMPHRVLRSASTVELGDPGSVLLYMLREGTCDLEQDGQSCLLGPGDIAWQDSSRPSAFAALTDFEMLVFSLPKWFLGPAAALFNSSGTAGQLVKGSASFSRIATPFLSGLAYAADLGGLSESEAKAATDMLLTLTHAFSTGVDADRSHSSELMTEIRRYILEHLDDESLNPSTIAAAHFISTRYVHKLFSSTGTSLVAWIRQRRLDRARLELQSSGRESIAEVARRAGYRDAASFSRAFREAFSESPRDVRSAPIPEHD